MEKGKSSSKSGRATLVSRLISYKPVCVYVRGYKCLKLRPYECVTCKTHVEKPCGDTIAPTQIFEGVDFFFLFIRRHHPPGDQNQPYKKDTTKELMRKYFLNNRCETAIKILSEKEK